jgi:hypothetical protein
MKTTRMHRATAAVAAAALLAWALFQISKQPALSEANPFGRDPYDAVGSIALQVALVAAGLAYARSLRMCSHPLRHHHPNLILRGNVVAILSIGVTVLAGGVAEVLNPKPPSPDARLLLAGLGGMALVTVYCAAALMHAFHGLPSVAPPSNLTLCDAIDDLWMFVRVPVQKLRARLPERVVWLVMTFHAERLFARIAAFDPRRHPWRFAGATGIAAGACLCLAEMQEGLPPGVPVGLLATSIFLGGETLAVLLGFALLGGYLGLRPPLRARR